MTLSSSSVDKDRSEYSSVDCYMTTTYTVTIRVFDAGKECNKLLGSMLGPLGSYFQDTVTVCFNVALDRMGPLVREAVVDQLRKKEIRESEIAIRFDDVMRVLGEKFKTTGRVIAYNTLVEVCEEYSFPVDFTQSDPLDEKFVFLKDRVLVDRLTPRHAQSKIREMQYQTPTYRSVFDSFSINSQRVQT